MVRSLFISLTGIVLVLSVALRSNAQRIDYFNGDSYLDLPGDDGIIIGNTFTPDEAHKKTAHVCDSIRKEIKKLRKTLDSARRSLNDLDLHDLNIDELIPDITPYLKSMPDVTIPPNFLLPDLKNPTDEFFKLIPPRETTPPDEDSRMPRYRGPNLRSPKHSRPLPDFPKWHIELLKDICKT
jgi:hypothetical protein